MQRQCTSAVYVVCVALAMMLVLVGWMVNLRLLFAQTQVQSEGGIWDRIFTAHVPRVAQEVRQGSASVKQILTPVLQEAQEQTRRQQAYEAAIKDLQSTIFPYGETGTQKTPLP